MVNRSVSKLLLAGIIVFSAYVIFTSLDDRTTLSNQLPAVNVSQVGIPDMPSFSLPISKTFNVKANSFYFFKVHIDANSTLLGNLREAHKLCILFYILDETGMKKWLVDVDVIREAYVYSRVSTNFTVTLTSGGTYYFVFDNKLVYHVCRDKLVTLEVRKIP